MKSIIKKSKFNLVKSFDDNSLSNFGGNLSIERSKEIEHLMMPQIKVEIEKLRALKNRIYLSK